MTRCPACNGARGFHSDNGPAPRWEVCSDCDGAGEWDEPDCPDCDGNGTVWNNADPTSGQFMECERCDTKRSIDKAHAMSTAWDRASAALSKRDTPGFNAAMAEFRKEQQA